ncbi:hypothetical protein [Marininema halotolerans]|uniref:hypothetical protein n=1 Tax=Marininema halotolerans TaxID=1155944 RepID=UPI0015963A83|nr:hypothetical protein [Marininema halotolerans]
MTQCQHISMTGVNGVNGVVADAVVALTNVAVVIALRTPISISLNAATMVQLQVK